MIFSMTAFARSDRDTPTAAFAWELRAVNHRYLETSVKLPEELRALEPQVRERVAQRIARGKIDCVLRFKARSAIGEARLDQAVVAQLNTLSRNIAALATSATPLHTIDYLHWPGVLITPELDIENVQGAALQVLDQALDDFVATRAREGERLGELLVQRLDAMAAVFAQVNAIAPEIVPHFRARLQTRLAELQGLDPARLEQEIVLFAQRSDIAEEIDRLQTHWQEALRVLKQGGQIGRRLDFLMQEFNREANTLASKSSDTRLTNAAVELKVLIEQMREQVQNIE